MTVFEVSLFVLLGVLALAALIVEPMACVGIVPKIVLAIALAGAGLMLLAQLWNWRRPKTALRARRFMSALSVAAGRHVAGSSVYRLWGSLSNPHQLVVRIAVPTDADRSQLNNSAFHTEFERLLVEFDLPLPRPSGVKLTIDSQETVDREYAGRWSQYDM